MLTLLAKLLQALNSENSTRQIALAIALALIVGLSPLVSLHNLVIILVVLLIRVHLGSFILAFGLFKGISLLLAPIMIGVGESLLTTQSLQGVFTQLYQTGWFKLAQWHHTYTFGAFVCGLVLAFPTYFLAKWLIEKYREHIKRYFESLPLIKLLKSSRIFQIYQGFSTAGERS